MNFDIDAGAPIILIPHSSRSTDILVMDMGTLTVRNSFHYADSIGTIGGKNTVMMNEKKRSASSAGSEGTLKPDDTLSTISDAADSGSASHTATKSTMSDSMSQSVYGSLDDDWRSNSLVSPQDTASSSNSLFSFFSAMGSTPSSTPLDQTARSSTSSFPAAGQARTPHLSCQEVSSPSEYKCLLDVMQVSLVDMDLFSAEWVSIDNYNPNIHQQQLSFPSFIIVRHQVSTSTTAVLPILYYRQTSD